MSRALVLNAGASWAAWQVGALAHLVGDRATRFDVCAGTGIGAMHAAFVACGELPALERFWDRIGLASLVRPNWRSPWRQGPFTGTPQRRFVAAHCNEARLVAEGVELAVTVLDLQSGHEQVLRYPGAGIPLADGIMAAVATPGVSPPLVHQGRQLVEATLVDGVPLRPIWERDDVTEIVAVLASPLAGGPGPPRRYATWRAVADRALAMNQAEDVRRGLAEAEETAAAAAAFRHVSASVPAALAGAVDDAALGARLGERLTGVYERSRFPVRRAAGPVVRALTPSADLAFPLWRFRRADLDAARTLGYADARAAFGEGIT